MEGRYLGMNGIYYVSEYYKISKQADKSHIVFLTCTYLDKLCFLLLTRSSIFIG